MGNIEKSAKILRKKLRNNIELVEVENYLKELGYDVVYYNTKSGDETLLALGLYDKSRNVDSFVFTNGAKFVFVDANKHAHDKLILLLHELGHILLKHVGDGKVSHRDKFYMELEAAAFAYMVLNPQKQRNVVRICAYLCSAVVLFGGGFFTQSYILQKNNVTNMTVAENVQTENIQDRNIQADNTEYVYITKTGKAYHNASCRQVKDNNCAAISLTEAKKLFAPCKVCNP